MLSPRLTNCPECANIPSLLKKIDCKLAELGNNLYNNISYMLNKPVPSSDILQLIGYRRILMHKYCNPNYVHKYSVQMIASRVIRLTAGCVSKCNEPERCLEEPCDIKIVPNPTTTSTSTLPITTTTSTSSTTSTTTTVVPTTTTTSSSSTSTTTTTTTGIPCNCVTFYNGSTSDQEITYIDCNGEPQFDLIDIGITSSYCGCCGEAPTPDVTISIGADCIGGLCPEISTSTTTTTTTAYVLACTAGYTGPVGFPNRTTGNGTMTLGSGLVINTTYTGPALLTGPQPPYSNCVGGQLAGNVGIGGTISLNYNGGAFTFTITYSTPQTAVKFVLAGIGYADQLGISEYYTVTTSAANTVVNLIDGCGDFRVESPNVVAGSMQNPINNIGGNIEVVADAPFTTITITGNNSASLAGTAWDMYICDAESTTTTTSSSSTSTTSTTTSSTSSTTSTTTTLSGFNTIYTHFESLTPLTTTTSTTTVGPIFGIGDILGTSNQAPFFRTYDVTLSEISQFPSVGVTANYGINASDACQYSIAAAGNFSPLQIKVSSDYANSYSIPSGFGSGYITETILSKNGKYMYIESGAVVSRSDNFGTSFSVISLPVPFTTVIQSSVSWNGQYVIILGQNVDVDVDVSVLLSTDYGITFTNITLNIFPSQSAANDSRAQAAAVSGNGSYMMVASAFGNSYRSIDFGVTWQIMNIVSQDFNEDLKLSYDGRYGIVSSINNRVITTNDFGVTWTTNTYSSFILKTDISNSGQYMLATLISGNTTLISSNYGTSWISYNDTNKRFLSFLN